jgi:hypothetical protein|tara:strand:+ start:106 stop:684 length:579 start_codon:yes stop_codon:yes gene_type:complete
MATKNELRHYAKTNNATLTEAREHFIKLAQKKPFTKFGTVNPLVNGIVFSVANEVKKVSDMVTNDLPVFNMKSTKKDFFNMYNKSEDGFVIAVIPTRNRLQTISLTSNIAQVKNTLDKFQMTRIDDNWSTLTCYSGAEQAYKLFNELSDTVATAFIAFSTPRNLSTLSETVSICEDYSAKRVCGKFIDAIAA